VNSKASEIDGGIGSATANRQVQSVGGDEPSRGRHGGNRRTDVIGDDQTGADDVEVP
jgi:hypothetical protein